MTALAYNRPAIYAAGREKPLSAAKNLVIYLLAIRWLAGIAENAGLPRLSEVTAIGMLAVLGVVFLLDPRFARASLFIVFGFVAWLVTSMQSFLANQVSSPTDALELAALLGLYALFANSAALHIKDLRSLPLIGKLLSLFVVVGGLLALWQVGSGQGFVEAGKATIVRAYGSDVHPVSFAIQMVAALTTLEIVRLKTGAAIRLSTVVIYTIGIVTIYLTFARTAWVMLPMTLGYALFAGASLRGRVAVSIVFAGTLAVIALVSDRFADLGSLPFFLSNFSFENLVFDYRIIDNSIAWRVVNWSFGLQQAAQQPWLGFGPGQSAAASLFSLEMHNIFLEQFFEGGVFGLCAFLLVLGGLIASHRRLPGDSASDRRARNLANGFGMALFFAVTFSTSLVDQLMSVLLYLLLLRAASIPAAAFQAPVAARKA